MSRIAKVLVALLAITAMVAPAVFAEDRLALSGSMQVRGFYTNIDVEDYDESDAWNDQRLRIGGKLSVAEGVSVNFRFDSTESDDDSSDAMPWGTNGQYTQRRADIQFDLAYLQLEKGGYTFQAGELYSGYYGIGTLSDILGTGFTIARGAAKIFHIKQQEGADESLTGAVYAFQGEGFSVTPMVAYATSEDNSKLLGLGLFAAVDLDAVKIKGEIDYFKGEDEDGNDAKGLQLYLDASAGVSETVTVGGLFLYAQGQDDDDQVTRMGGTGFGGFSPQTYGFNTTDFSLDVDCFNPVGDTGSDEGVIAGQLYADVALSDDLKAKFAAMYWTVEDDFDGDADGYVLNASASYALMANTTLTTSLNYSMTDLDGTDLDVIQAITGLYVNF